MPKYAKRRDANQSSLERVLTGHGLRWRDMSRAGDGFPDLIVLDMRGRIRLLECKNPDTAYGRKGLNDAQSKMEREGWPIDVAQDADDLLTIIKSWEKRK